MSSFMMESEEFGSSLRGSDCRRRRGAYSHGAVGNRLAGNGSDSHDCQHGGPQKEAFDRAVPRRERVQCEWACLKTINSAKEMQAGRRR